MASFGRGGSGAPRTTYVEAVAVPARNGVSVGVFNGSVEASAGVVKSGAEKRGLPQPSWREESPGRDCPVATTAPLPLRAEARYVWGERNHT